MASFAITTPKYGVGEHVPKILLSQAFISQDSRNVRELHGDYRAARGRLPALCDAGGLQIAAPQGIYAVAGVDQATKTLTVAGNHAAAISAAITGNAVRINGSTGNDGLYAVVSVTDVGGNTAIVVSEALADATVDGNVFVGAAQVLAYHLYTKEATGAEYLLLATAYHILLWNQPARTLTPKFTCSAPNSVTMWFLATHCDCVYATNGVDSVLKWGSAVSVGGNFEPLENAQGVRISDAPSYLTKAQCLYSAQGYLWLGGTTEDGTFCPRRVRYSDANADTFDITAGGDAGLKDLDDTCGFVTGFAGLQNYVIIAAEHRMTRAWLTETDIPWYFDTDRVRAGCIAPKTLVNDRNGRLYWLAEDLTVREFEGASPVSSPHAAKTLKQLNVHAVQFACAAYYENLDRLLFAVPTANSDHNDLLVEMDPDMQIVVYHDIPVDAFGQYHRQLVYTWDTLPYDTYDEWGAAWLVYDATANTIGFPLLLVANQDGYSYEFDQSDKDASATMERRLVFETGLLEPEKRLSVYKRIMEGIDLFFQRHAETQVTLYAKTDGCRDWIVVGTSDLTGDGQEADQVAVHLDADMRAKHFTFKIVADGYFEFAGLCVNNFILDGVR